MSNPYAQPQLENYDSRWFIWTIVFLVVTGISLVSYIVLSDNGTNDVSSIPTAIHSQTHKTTEK
ncbi:MAG: hypothetical protein HY918_03835 [Candidatus Doudnabacteria bacterium]|nr:hypothetical protein [Candidatus Doudnabacteria bacterium]